MVSHCHNKTKTQTSCPDESYQAITQQGHRVDLSLGLKEPLNIRQWLIQFTLPQTQRVFITSWFNMLTATVVTPQHTPIPRIWWLLVSLKGCVHYSLWTREWCQNFNYQSTPSTVNFLFSISFLSRMDKRLVIYSLYLCGVCYCFEGFQRTSYLSGHSFTHFKSSGMCPAKTAFNGSSLPLLVHTTKHVSICDSSVLKQHIWTVTWHKDNQSWKQSTC
jgi:hypothetical protein